ncbi:MAG TPA: hypothetical protein ENK18_05070, partial [Deltaproteobacteria bacterium]|nr:hypothetical protein [Deltaproteobacteria bacterium]
MPPYLLIGLGGLLPLLGIGSRWWQGRMLTWLLCMASVLFALIAQWDWMHGFRWYAPAVVPGSVLFALGAASLATVVQRVLDPSGARWTIDEGWLTRRARGIRYGIYLVLLVSICAGLVYQGDWLLEQSKALATVGLKDTLHPLVIVVAVLGVLYTGLELTILALVRDPATSAHRWTLPGYATAIGLTLAAVPANALHTKQIASKPQTKPEHVLARVNYVDGVRDRLHIEERLRDLDVDQGAHLLWSDFEMYDIAGLIDVPLGHHKFERSFVHEYLFEEVRPHFAHVHGGWSTNSRIPTHPEWRNDYLEIPGYVANRTSMHIGNHIRRDTIVSDSWPHGPGPVAVDDNVVLHGLWVPSEPAAGRGLYLEVGVSARRRRKVEADDFRLLLFISNDRGDSHQWELPPGYDWLWPHEWKPQEIFVGKFDLTLPKELEPGRYDLGLIVIDSGGRIVQPQLDEDQLPDGVVIGGISPDHPARIARGEIRYQDALQILTKEGRAAAAVEDREAALALAAALRCDEAEQRWFLARKHRPTEEDWVEEHQATVRRALARCHAERSDTLESISDKVAALVRARELDHWEPTYRDRASALADDLHARGLEAREIGDWEAAYRLFADAVAVDRTRSWSRRYAEEARA